MSSFEIKLDHENRLVRVTGTGEFFQPDGEKLITAARTAAGERDYSIFYDMRRATTTVHFASWFSLPRKLDVFNQLKTRRVKAAILVLKEDKAVEDYKFYELVTDNIGIKIRVFFDETEAFTWLTEGPMLPDNTRQKHQTT